jgi:hypothetical protein
MSNRLQSDLCVQGFCVVATPIPFSIFDHYEASREASMTLKRGLIEVRHVILVLLLYHPLIQISLCLSYCDIKLPYTKG